MKAKVVSVLAVVVCLAGAARGSLVFNDPFSYPDGAITNVSGGIWSTHSGGGAGQEVLVVSGMAQLNSARGEDVNALLAGQPYTTGSGTVLYAGFTVNFSALPLAAGTYFAQFNTGANYRCRVWASTTGAASGYRLGVGNGSGASASSGQLASDLALNTTYALVVRYDVGSGVSTIWLNPAAESDPSVTAVDTPSPTNVTVISFRQNSGMGTLLLDDLKVGTAFTDIVTNSPPSPPVITAQPQSQAVAAGVNVTFTVVASGTPPLSYQWQSNSTSIAGGTNSTLTLTSVTTNQSGNNYSVTVTNIAGATNSQAATLTVTNAVLVTNTTLMVMIYNTKGNGAPDWSTNAAQVQAIGRQLIYLKPDVVAFNEIPRTYLWQMTNWVKAYLPGYSLATNSGTDGILHSVIASRFPITRSQSWLDGVSLAAFGYNGNFTRDLFEAQIAVPGFPQPLHVFVTHLKATTIFTNFTLSTAEATRRAAEAGAISNFFVNGFLTTNSLRPYILCGDLNEDIFRPDTNNYTTGFPIQRLTNGTGLRLTTPVNPVTAQDLTLSIQGSLNVRFDYILPCGLLFSNVASSQVFRTDRLTPVPPGLFANDSRDASDHLPVVMVFNNPYNQPFRLTSLARTNPNVTLKWESVIGQIYRVESSSNLTAWTTLATNLIATGASYTMSSNVSGEVKFFRVLHNP